MIMLLSGEGSSDIGNTDNAGPMAKLVDLLVTAIWGYSPLETGAFEFIDKRELTNAAPARPRNPVSRKLGQPVGQRYFYRAAYALAQKAKQRCAETGCPVGAVLFHDSDGTRRIINGLWRNKVESVQQGFAAAEYEFGVPMIPNPKSEAWLLCRYQANPYTNCARFESCSGNDDSPQSLKAMLAEALNCNEKDTYYHVDVSTICWDRVKMDSFNFFQKRLEHIALKLSGKPFRIL